MKETIRLSLAAAVLFTMGVTTIIMIWPEPFIRIFNADQELIHMGKGMLRIYVAGMFVRHTDSFDLHAAGIAAMGSHGGSFSGAGGRSDNYGNKCRLF